MRTPDPKLPADAFRATRIWYVGEGNARRRGGEIHIVFATPDAWRRMTAGNPGDRKLWSVSRFAGGWLLAVRLVLEGQEPDGDMLRPGEYQGDAKLLREFRNRLLQVLEGDGFNLWSLMLYEGGGCGFRVTLPDDPQDRGIDVDIKAEH